MVIHCWEKVACGEGGPRSYGFRANKAEFGLREVFSAPCGHKGFSFM